MGRYDFRKGKKMVLRNRGEERGLMLGREGKSGKKLTERKIKIVIAIIFLTFCISLSHFQVS